MSTNEILMNQEAGLFSMPEFASKEEERADRKTRLVAAYRLFAKFGFEEGVAGHITVRDPILTDHFWVNPMGVPFGHITQDSLLLVNHDGEVVEGRGMLNGAAFTIHSHIHAARPDIDAAAHCHAVYGKAWSSLGRLLDPITQDACAFYEDHVLFDDFTGVVLDMSEGERLAKALGDNKAAILRNHGLLTVGKTIDEAAWWYITMERTCQAQLMAEAAGKPVLIDHDHAKNTYNTVGSSEVGWYIFQTLYQKITREQPDILQG
ncbi:class II aldolase/adducin family protein [Maricurvus nonylphenolicus]